MVKDKGYTTIRIQSSTKKKLENVGKKTDTFDSIILKLLKK